MDIHFDHALLEALVKAGVKSPVFKNEQGYFRSKDVDSRFIDPKDFEIVKKIAKKPEFAKDIDNRRVLRKLNALEAMGEVDESTQVKKLELLPDAIRQAVDKAPRRWVFKEDEGLLLPFYVERAKFHPAEASSHGYTPASVTMDLEAICRGEKVSKVIHFSKGDLPNTIKKIFSDNNLLLATDVLIKDFDAETKTYLAQAPQTGEQFLAHGSGEVVGDSSWNRDKVSFDKGDVPSKVVMDDEAERGEDSDVADTSWWAKKPLTDEDDLSDEALEEVMACVEDAAKVVLLPAHPFVRVFNLATHEYCDTHITNLEPYVYDAQVIDKLVLPEAHKKLIDALTGSAIKQMSDIIKGKAQGIIILCSGLPGTGKTLTAEVYSEAAQRPLYMVQCSQLGTDEEALEKHLAEVLDRATRWRTILLIDEADVYIHERGDNIKQNAIVGVFLRLLEYYNGILFLTTNRVTVVDDAILSRTTAHVKYKLPEGPDRVRLWEILLAQYGIKATAKLTSEAIEAFPEVSGRSIRQLVRLGLIVGQGSLTVDNLVAASKFHDFEEGQKS